MPVSSEFEDYIVERLETVGDITSRKMFGGIGFYLNNYFIALAADNVVYFKVDESNLPDYKKAGMEPFRPYKDNPNHMNYYEVPPDVIEQDDLLNLWAQKALLVAQNANRKKKKK